MVKYLAIASYWLGVLCAALAIGSRICNAVGIGFRSFVTRGNPIDVHSFMDAALLLLFIAIASTNYLLIQAPQKRE
jgi:hypothetical protein